MILRAGAVWLLVLVLAIANGGFREAVLKLRTGERAAHVLSTVMLCAVVLVVARLTIGWIAPGSVRDALSVGGLWLVLTLAFEFGAGRWLFRKSWSELLADYDLRAGRVWPAVPVVTMVAPLLAWWHARP